MVSVSPWSALGDRHDRSGLHVYGVFGFVSQMRAPVFHLRDASVWILRVHPVLIRSLPGSLPIQLRQLLARRCLDVAFLRQPRQELLVTFSSVTPHNRLQRRVGLQRGRVHAD